MRNLNSSMVIIPALVGLAMSLVQLFTDSDEQRLKNTVVWEVSGPNIEKPSYLVGTIHMLCEEDFLIDARIRKSFDNTEQLFLEVDFDDPTVIHEMMMKESLAKKPLKKRLSQAQYARFSEYLENHSQFSIDTFEQLNYMGIYSFLSLESVSCQNIKMFEQELMVLAHKSDKEIYGLETMADRKKVFAALTPEKDEMMSEAHITMFREMKQTFVEMVDIYQQEDIVMMMEFMANSNGLFMKWDEVKAVLLDERNHKWVDKISIVVQQKPTVFAFGAGHLAGEQGVIQLLRDAGLNVKPIMK